MGARLLDYQIMKIKKGGRGERRKVTMQKWFERIRKERETHFKLFLLITLLSLCRLIDLQSAALRWHLAVLVGLQWDPWVHRQSLVVSPGSQHHLHLPEICSKSCMKHCWEGCVHHLWPLSGVDSCKNMRMSFRIEETQLKEIMGKLTQRCSNAEGTASQQGSPSAEHKMFSFRCPFIHACRANSLSLSSYNKTRHFSAVTIP